MNVRLLALRATLVLGCLLVAVALAAQTANQTRNDASQDPGSTWSMPRTPDGHPDLQGNWTNATITPIQRPEGRDLVLTPEQIAQVEGRRQQVIEVTSRPSDPDRVAPPVGGDGSTGAAGGVGGYNYFYIDAGDRVAIYNGEPRSSLIVDPPDGRLPPLTAEARRARGERRAAAEGDGVGPYDNPENRPLAERCIMSFGSNAGPPMLPNYFYNNNYTIVQTADHVMILTEMVHDARIIKLGEPQPTPDHIRPWWGVSWGRWEGDTLVVETTNVSETQLRGGRYPGGSADMRVIERFTRADEDTINYEFTVDDPSTYTAPWSGQVPFEKLDGLIYEYACHEANYSLFNVLSGARAQEREGRQRP